MKALRWCVVLLLSTSMMAQTAGTAAPRKSSRKKAAAVTAEDLQALRESIAEQQRQIQELREMVMRSEQGRQQAERALQEAQSAAREAQSQSSAFSSSLEEQKQAVTSLQSNMEDVKSTLTNTAVSTQEDQKRVGALEGVVNRFRFTGDVRVRYENFYQEGVNTRHRERIRLRFGVQGKLNEDFQGGIFLASGTWSNGSPSLADPVSTNETLTGFFERKAVGFDRGWITYNPQAHKWLELTGGKFAYNWARTIMVFDGDLNPEGFSEKLNFKLSNKVVKNVSFQALQLMFNEVSGGIDSFAAGGSFGTQLVFGPVTLNPSYTILNWRNADAIAQAASPATIPGVVLPVAGGLGGETVTLPTTTATRIINANAMTNATRNCGGVASPHPECRLGGAAHREFVSKFLYSDFILDVGIKTPWKRWPIKLTAEYMKNLDAENEDPLAVGKQDSAYWFEAAFGQQKAKNDLLFGYSFGHVEQDALLSQFSDSDFRAPTNLVQHRLYGNWRVADKVTAAYTLFVGRTLNCNLQNAAKATGFTCNAVAPFNTEPWLKRMQFDLIYSF